MNLMSYATIIIFIGVVISFSLTINSFHKKRILQEKHESLKSLLVMFLLKNFVIMSVAVIIFLVCAYFYNN